MKGTLVMAVEASVEAIELQNYIPSVSGIRRLRPPDGYRQTNPGGAARGAVATTRSGRILVRVASTVSSDGNGGRVRADSGRLPGFNRRLAH